MGLSRYNRVFNLSLAVVVIYNILCMADIIFASIDLNSLISKSAVIYLIYACGMLGYKIHLALKYFIGSKDTIINLVAHLVLIITSVIMILITAF